jgi:hypothetical protein
VTAASVRPGTRPVPLLVFIHIPKAAGTTLANLLRIHYPDGFHRGTSVFAGVEQVEEPLRALAADSSTRAVSGHLTFGLRDRLPPDARYLTMLRDPVERTLSHYSFLVRYFFARARSTPDVKGAGLVAPWLPAPSDAPTLDECIAEGSYIPDNLQTRMLCGLVSPFDELPLDALDQARHNLRDGFAFVGTTERFEEFLALLNIELDWPTVAFKRYKENTRRLGKEQLPVETLRAVEERNALDRELHAYAGELLEEALERAGPELDAEVEVLRRAAARRHGSAGEVEGARSGTAIRSLPVEARVELAIKEGELARAELRMLSRRGRGR